MEKRRKWFILSALLIMVIALSLSLVACNPKKGSNDEKTRPFTMSIETPDGVFNPFFSTSAYDSSIIGLTQISMLSTGSSSANGYVVCGDNEPTVVQEYMELDEGLKYSFLIKNGIQFSDGTPLTIKDVLFNLYVYLDPAFTGSATIYSTDIKGLREYRTQDSTMTEEGESGFNATFRTRAASRISTLIDWVICMNRTGKTDDQPWRTDWQYVKETGEPATKADVDAGKELVKMTWDYKRPGENDYYFSKYTTSDDNTFDLISDYHNVKEVFLEELKSDWNAISLEDYKDWEGFDEKWQVFMMSDGGRDELLKREYEGGPYEKVQDDRDWLKMDSEAANRMWRAEIMLPIIQDELDPNFNYTSDEAMDAKIAEYKSSMTALQFEEKIRDFCIDTVFQGYFPEPDGEDPNTAIPRTNGDSFRQVLRYWMTADTVLTNWTADEKGKMFGDQLEVDHIEGITVEKVHTFNGRTLDSDHYVLNIELNKVDPKAIYNFSFTVAPMHYYSSDALVAKFNETFDAWERGEVEYLTGFGVKFSDSDFMTKTVNNPDRVIFPVGAGPYMACDENDNSDWHSSSVREGFYNLNMVYYKANPYFNTVAKNIENAHIEHVRYKVVASDQIINSLGNDIDFGDPSATQDNLQKIQAKGLQYARTKTSGYGYVGINPRFVPTLAVRRAIIKAMNTTIIMQNYYKNNFADPIFRPMSTTSWLYDENLDGLAGVGVYTSRAATGSVSYAYDSVGNDIENLVIGAGYTKNGGVYEKNVPGYGLDRLDYEFTIAGGSTDHPAYAMFLAAVDLLNRHGFDVRVVTSATALTDLSAGKLKVWAAAWSSTIDPDMYQVYHMESQASSVNNWGYKQILANQTTYGVEYGIIEELSEKIDEAREVTDPDSRAPLYKSALDLVMELAVEFPIYQRYDLSAFDGSVLDRSSMPSDSVLGPYYGLLSRIWEVRYR